MTHHNTISSRASTLDGNEAAASVAYRLSETIAIYPITPSSTMAEFADEWSSRELPNLWGTVPHLVEMQSEGGVAGAIHGMLQAGSLSTTFTASQGLLLMIPNMYKIAGELTPFCMHVSARTLATHALSIFGDHSDVMACRQIGFAMLCSGSVQEAHDFAAVSHSVTLKSRVPFLHFFDGFRTSHEVAKIQMLEDAALAELVPAEDIERFRQLALTPDQPRIRGTAQNPDVFFQAREACNPYYDSIPARVEEAFEKLAKLTGRKYRPFDYAGHPEAERVVVLMGSGAETAHETVNALTAKGEKVGVLKVRLFRPFSTRHLLAALPKSVRALAVLDRTKEPGALGEPLYQDVITGLSEAQAEGSLAKFPRVIGGRYGLSSKEFTPAMVKAVFDELRKEHPKNHFTVGIHDDVSGTSLPFDTNFDIEPREVARCVFFGLGADGTVGANKNSIKIIGEETENFAQGYFVYDSKKSGAITISHLRFGPNPIQSSYLVTRANFVACHQWDFLDKYDVLGPAAEGAVLLLNSAYAKDQVWDRLSRENQQQIIAKKLKVYVIDAYSVARATGMGGRINTIMQTCFFAISGVLPREDAIKQIKKAIEKTYAKKGADVIARNFEAVDQTLAALHEVRVPAKADSTRTKPPIVSEHAPEFVKRVTSVMMAGQGDLLPVSAFPVDGTWPMGTTRWEKRNVGLEIPVWNEKICIQCNKCAFVCPHAAIRPAIYEPAHLSEAPASFKAVDFKSNEHPGLKYSLQVAPEDCTGCGVCIQVCPVKDKANPKDKAINLAPQEPIREVERENYEFFLKLPYRDRSVMTGDTKTTQFLEPLFEYSGACAGCGETPYIKLLTQLYGDRLYIANATGCSSIYGGNLPTTPYTCNSQGRGPAWSNSLFEDNAEYGFGMRVALDKHVEQAQELVKKLSGALGDTLVTQLLSADQSTETGIQQQRERVLELRKKLVSHRDPAARRLELLADYLVQKSVWIVGGDGWAYDIGYGGLDHVLAMGRKVNILVMDTEVYSNTGGQASKSTPMGASAKFAVAGKVTPKKDLGLIAMSYGNAYVARVAFGAKDIQTVKAFTEAESFPGTSIIIAYSHCIAHGYGLQKGLEQQKLAVDSGHWPLFRFDPRRVGTSEPALRLDSTAPKVPLKRYIENEIRYRMLESSAPEQAQKLQASAQQLVNQRYEFYQHLAKLHGGTSSEGETK
ncbi:MAG: pyruvate:ferredoxin (flavodoxin) oxidoreductase [Oligoflexia bacterium]|nr:pyruvate:ferredoxin (flavodoxin) oxidoreductase [Oligoflexia bacterium]